MLQLGPPTISATPIAVIVTKDLFFGSQVTGTAKAQGRSIAMAMTIETLKDHLASGTVRGVILDLAGEIAPADVIAALPDQSRPKTLAFGAHVHTASLQSARDAGFDQVMPRSKFSAELVPLIEWVTR
jgi:hypothetical protein